ncbi:hypothetical protein Poli38472_013565 [Pythium oligandrum]|uniref:STAS domain-containing protein n=1 Tax=Pythium oligandrum TaxID=41045 RepID=A0A8K1CD78_PYTOL|nr:hypothetical protein Poli38472_013565 [Pythium oligandrum]|eukprot:TMW61102.1 hypothetical protein Poli38472_013565 [Pythium oligandrum]
MARDDEALLVSKAPMGGKLQLVQGAVQAILAGMIIAIVMCPLMIGYAAMIYGHDEFESVMPMLTKLVFMSSIAHQLVITIRSPLSFAIGQTQDAGLIFLSTMATSIMVELGPTVPFQERIATVVVHLSICTAMVGFGLIVFGKLRLASLVNYLPTPVIGGYLAFIGFFVLKGGITLMTGTALKTLGSWTQLFTGHQMALLLPGVLCGLALSYITARYHHFAVFPGCLIAMPVIFFLVLWISGITMDEARSYGYLSPETPRIALGDVYGLFHFSTIHWEVMFPLQLPTVFSMFCVIALASTLDIVSASMGTGSPMEYNQQLQTVGVSNLVTGLTGGYTGSYIFSQTIFSHRLHPAAIEAQYPGFSRLIGLSLIICEFCIVLTPFSLTTVIPKFLFGSVLVFIGVELLKTWIIGVYRKLLLVEYLTALATFIFLNVFGVQLGLAAGVGLAALCFLIEYARSEAVRVVQSTSDVIRTAEQHELLHGGSAVEEDAWLKKQRVVTLQLHGHIFFGSVVHIQERVKEAVCIRSKATKPQTHGHASMVHPMRHDHRMPLLAMNHGVHPPLQKLDGKLCCDEHRGRTRFVVFDFSQVSGLDATAARSCFLALKMLFKQHKITVVYCGMKEKIEFLLRANDVFSTDGHDDELCHTTSDVDLALDWCEQQLILAAAKKRSLDSGQSLQAVLPPATQELPLAQIFKAYLSTERRNTPEVTQAIDDVAKQFAIQRWKQTERVFVVGETSDSWFVLLRGQVTLYTKTDSSEASDSPHFTNPFVSNLRRRRYGSGNQHVASQPNSTTADTASDRELFARVRAGCIFGDMDFVLQQPRAIEAVCTEDDTVTAMIPRSSMEKLLQTQPQVAFALQEAVLRASYMALTEKLHSLVI